MRLIATAVARSVVCVTVCLSICLYDGHTGELCKDDAAWELTHMGPKNHVLNGMK